MMELCGYLTGSRDTSAERMEAAAIPAKRIVQVGDGCGSFETTHFDFFNSRLRYLQGRDTPHSGISGDARVPVVCETANILQSHRWSEANATLTPPPHFAGANVPRSGPCDL